MDLSVQNDLLIDTCKKMGFELSDMWNLVIFHISAFPVFVFHFSFSPSFYYSIILSWSTPEPRGFRVLLSYSWASHVACGSQANNKKDDQPTAGEVLITWVAKNHRHVTARRRNFVDPIISFEHMWTLSIPGSYSCVWHVSRWHSRCWCHTWHVSRRVTRTTIDGNIMEWKRSDFEISS